MSLVKRVLMPATVEDITEKADIGKGTLYRHFADKEEMVLVPMEDAIERLRSYSEEPENLEDVLMSPCVFLGRE